MKAKDLRNSILQLAVEGRLVPQDATEEPAGELMARIRDERRRLVAAGKAKAPKGGESVICRGEDGSWYERRGKGEPRCIDKEVPFDIPEGWEWARLGAICVLARGNGIKRCETTKDGLPCIRYGELYTTYSVAIEKVVSHTSEAVYNASHKLEPNSVLMTLTGENDIDIGKAAANRTTEALAYGGDLLGLGSDAMYGSFLAMVINGPYIQKQRTTKATGKIIVHLSVDKVSDFLVAVPPLAEQWRIVAKVDELMPLVGEYERLEEERERLDSELPGRLRKSVLQLAVEGRLVPQDATEEPASELMARIRDERRRLVAAGRAKAPKGGESVICRGEDGSWYERRGKGELRCIDGEIPFDIPESWEWARLSTLASFAGGKTPSTSDKSNYEDNGILWVTSKDMKKDFIDSTLITLSEKGAASLTLYEPGTILMVTRSGILRRLLPVAMLTKPATVNQDQKAICPFDFSVSLWLLAYLKASDNRIRRDYSKAGTTVESVVFEEVKNMLVPLPPLAEQRRIVAKVDELMPLVEDETGQEAKNGGKTDE